MNVDKVMLETEAAFKAACEEAGHTGDLFKAPAYIDFDPAVADSVCSYGQWQIRRLGFAHDTDGLVPALPAVFRTNRKVSPRGS